MTYISRSIALPFAALATLSFIAVGCSANEAESNDQSNEAILGTPGTVGFVRADGDLVDVRCQRSETGFTATATVNNLGNYDATYIVTAKIESPTRKSQLSTVTSEPTAVAKSKSAKVELTSFGAEAPVDAVCSVSARKQKVMPS